MRQIQFNQGDHFSYEKPRRWHQQMLLLFSNELMVAFEFNECIQRQPIVSLKFEQKWTRINQLNFVVSLVSYTKPLRISSHVNMTMFTDWLWLLCHVSQAAGTEGNSQNQLGSSNRKHTRVAPRKGTYRAECNKKKKYENYCVFCLKEISLIQVWQITD